jgi:hypothetical protein
MALLLIFSSVLVRQRCYEAFLILHIMFSILTIVGLFWYGFLNDVSWQRLTFIKSYRNFSRILQWLFVAISCALAF